jgi:hypothetical protein
MDLSVLCFKLRNSLSHVVIVYENRGVYVQNSSHNVVRQSNGEKALQLVFGFSAPDPVS